MSVEKDRIDEACKSLPEAIKEQIAVELYTILKLDLDREHAIDGEYAYLWSDLLSVEDLIEQTGGLIAGPDQVGILIGLIKVWFRHRQTRIKLTSDQALVLKRVKKSQLTHDELVETFKGTPVSNKLNNVINSLLALKDPLGRPVLELEKKSQRYATPF